MRPEDQWTFDRILLTVGLLLAIAVTVHIEHCEPMWLGKLGVALLWIGVGFGAREEIASLNLAETDLASVLEDGHSRDQS